MSCSKIVGIALALTLCVGCARPVETEESPSALARLDEHLTLGAPVVVENLTVWPVMTDEPLDVGEFVTLKEASESGAAEVREVGGGDAQQQARGGATVGTLVIENRGDLPILVCAGTVVKGGNQDRQIAQDLVIEAKATVPIEAFCVEQGRWVASRFGQVTDGKFTIGDSVAPPSVREPAQYREDQGAVWQEVAKVKGATTFRLTHAITEELVELDLENLRVHRRSSSLAVQLDATDEVSGKDLEAAAARIREHFDALGEEPVGFAYSINGKPVNVRTFAHNRVFAKQFASFTKTMTTEAYLARSDGEVPEARAEDVVAMVREINKARESIKETAASNRNGIKLNDAGYNANCYVNRVVVTRDWTRK